MKPRLSQCGIGRGGEDEGDPGNGSCLSVRFQKVLCDFNFFFFIDKKRLLF